MTKVPTRRNLRDRNRISTHTIPPCLRSCFIWNDLQMSMLVNLLEMQSRWLASHLIINNVYQALASNSAKSPSPSISKMVDQSPICEKFASRWKSQLFIANISGFSFASQEVCFPMTFVVAILLTILSDHHGVNKWFHAMFTTRLYKKPFRWQ